MNKCRRPLNKLPLAAFALTALAAASAIPYSSPVRAAGAIQHCQDRDGTSIYTDRGCSALGAKRLPMSGELLTRIAHSQAASSRDGNDSAGFGGYASPRPVSERRSPASGCARSTTQLAMDLEGAFALGDVNRIAESYHWVGLSSDQGTQIMQRLDRLAEQPLLQAHYFDASIGGAGMQLASAGASGASGGGMMQLMFGGQTSQGSTPASVHDFDVQRYHGCYFIRF